jgi:hypothetical protein
LPKPERLITAHRAEVGGCYIQDHLGKVHLAKVIIQEKLQRLSAVALAHKVGSQGDPQPRGSPPVDFSQGQATDDPVLSILDGVESAAGILASPLEPIVVLGGGALGKVKRLVQRVYG